VFLEFFGAGQNGQAKGFYQQQLEYMYRTGDYVMNLNAAHLKAFPGAHPKLVFARSTCCCE
jgi:hypothetical protein